MEQYKYPGFDQLPEDSVIKLSLPLCDILRSLIGERDFSYLSTAFYPLEMAEVILQYLKYGRGVGEELIDGFAKKYLTEDSLFPIDELLKLWGIEKFNLMIAELQTLAEV